MSGLHRVRGIVIPSEARNPVVVVGSCIRSLPSYPRHHMAPFPGACGRGCAPVPNPMWGEDCLSEASSAALTFGTGAKAPGGPRPGAHGFGSFCRNKRTSSRGAETPHSSPSARRAETPREPLSTPFCHPRLDRGSSVFAFSSCTRAISWRCLLNGHSERSEESRSFCSPGILRNPRSLAIEGPDSGAAALPAPAALLPR